MDVANLEADRLHDAIKTKELVHDDVMYILSTRNFYQLRTTFESYKKKYGNPIDKVLLPSISIMQSTYFIFLWTEEIFWQDIMKSAKGDLESLLKKVILCIDSPEKHFAEVSVSFFLAKQLINKP